MPDGKIIAVGVVSILGYDAYQLHVLRSAKIGLIGSQHTTINRDVHTHVLEHKARGVALLVALEGDVLQRQVIHTIDGPHAFGVRGVVVAEDHIRGVTALSAEGDSSIG